ncbi:hypothetical protein FB009_105326 [Sinorhizobium medicae]|nr:hypothetical protein FB009_105326 [Sinorhizobium medicae]
MEAGGNLYRLDPSSEGAGPEVASGAYYDHIRKINDVFADQIKTSDQKAAYIFTFMFAFLVTSQEGRSVFAWHRYMEASSISMVFSAMLALASIFSIISAILVVLPRKSATSTTLFWGAWSKHRDSFIRAAGSGDQPIFSANMPRMRMRLLRSPVENTAASASPSAGCS